MLPNNDLEIPKSENAETIPTWDGKNDGRAFMKSLFCAPIK